MPDDLKRFRAITLHHPIIMGRRTFSSIGRPLPKRDNIIVTHEASFSAEGCIIARSLEEAISLAAKYGSEAMIIGGAQLFSEALPKCGRMYLTTIQQTFPEADVFFPEFSMQEWRVKERQEFAKDEQNPYPCYLEILERLSTEAI